MRKRGEDEYRTAECCKGEHRELYTGRLPTQSKRTVSTKKNTYARIPLGQNVIEMEEQGAWRVVDMVNGLAVQA